MSQTLFQVNTQELYQIHFRYDVTYDRPVVLVPPLKFADLIPLRYSYKVVSLKRSAPSQQSLCAPTFDEVT